MAAHHSDGSVSHDSNDESDYHENESRNTNTRSRAGGSGSNNNSKKKPSTSRRSSNQADDSKDAHHDDPADPQNARKMQNRLAQREFRARRLEHIKELEARVEFLSKPQSEQTEILVAIIHGLMDENKQLRGALKTMATFVASGVGGFSHAIQLPEYDDALDLVNRGDRALLLKLVQEKGSSVGAASNNQHNQGSQSTYTTTNARKTSPSPPATSGRVGSISNPGSHSVHVDKKRKSESSTHEATPEVSARPNAAKASRTRSHNTRGGRQDAGANDSKGQWQQRTPRDTPPVSTSSLEQNYVQQEALQQYPARPDSQNTATGNMPLSQSNQGGDSCMIGMFPTYGGGVGSMTSFDIFGDNSTSQNGVSSNASSALGPGGASSPSKVTSGGIKQEESPTLAPYQDPAAAWMNAYTNLTPMGGGESFWSLTSSALSMPASNNNNQQQQQQQQGPMSDSQNGRGSSSAFAPIWNTTSQMLASNNLNSFTGARQGLQQQQSLHGYA